MSDYLESKLDGWLQGTAPGASPAGQYARLWNGDPTDSGGGGAEVTATIRPAGGVGITFGAYSNGVRSNSAVVDFGSAAGGATVTHIGVWDAATAGNMLFSAPVSGGTQTVAAGASVTFPIGSIVRTLD
jgi:hypothetical protein